MPLVHVTKAFIAQDIIRDGSIAPDDRDALGLLAYFFYGRAAYRVHGDGAIKQAAASPFAFVFDPELIGEAEYIHAIDTGAFAARLYSHVLMDEMNVGDFSLGQDRSRPSKLIHAIFKNRTVYYHGDREAVPPADELATPDEFLVHAYANLVRSPGRNEPDDRVSAIEVAFSKPVQLAGPLRAVITPDNLWNERHNSPFLTALASTGVDVLPYAFVHGRAPDYYFAMIETELRKYLTPVHLP